MTKKIIISAFILAGAIFAEDASAQALPFTAIDRDPVSVAKGGTITGLSSTAYAAFGNTAAIPFAEESADFSAGYTMWQPDAVKTDFINAAGSYKIKDRFGVAAAVTYGMMPSYDIIDGSGYVKDSFKPSAMHINAGFAWRFIDNLSVGVNLGYASNSLSKDNSYGTLNADVYLMARFGGFKAALGAVELGPKVKSVSGTAFSLPSAVKIGAGYEASFAEKHYVSADIEADYAFTGGLAAAAGVEYVFNKMAAVRAGYRYGGETSVPSFASFGAGVRFAGIKADVAYLIGNKTTGNTLCIALGYAF